MVLSIFNVVSDVMTTIVTTIVVVANVIATVVLALFMADGIAIVVDGTTFVVTDVIVIF